eukprot:Nitzschia sp. Nitz4//scaffold92_size79448//72925//76351//NITZ4_005405-RA/size79448-augustus-gene-0.27-mRNA-1//1//CDS//3329560228//8172//frame0
MAVITMIPNKSTTTENTPLLSKDDVPASPKRCAVLLEIIGARHLPLADRNTYCVIQFGPKTLHRTKPFVPKINRTAQLFSWRGHPTQTRSLRDPIWTLQDDSLTKFVISQADVKNKQLLKITIWGKPRQVNIKDRAVSVVAPMLQQRHLESMGKVQLQADEVLNKATEKRLELQLRDDIGNPVFDSQGHPSLLAFRCRLATEADCCFVDDWEKGVDPPERFQHADVIPYPDHTRADIVTELPEPTILSQVPNITQRVPTGLIRVKPYAQNAQNRFISELELKAKTSLPSTKWVQAGSKASSYGRLYLEILSAHGLPNVDVGGSVGNETDAFCAAVYGDSMVQTDVIFDELSPHWPCWSQRAFAFHMQHPSQVLYIAVFGFKRTPLPHAAIGRFEVNPLHFRNGTTYHLEYSLCGQSHSSERQSRGTLRIRVRVEVDERKALLAALNIPPPVYVNTVKKKSMGVARYTACGEYDNEGKFSLQVLQGYIDEIVEGYIKRILYSLQDGTQSLVFWRSQVTVLGIGLPLYSCLVFIMGIVAVEHPHLIPAFLCFGLATFLLYEMQARLASPSPWRRCLSFMHYFQVLILGFSTLSPTFIHAHEGAAQMLALELALEQRRKQEQEFNEKKEAFERELEEIENVEVQNKSKTIPLELLVVLGKVQGIVGDICRLCRFLDAILSWEESDISFWITLLLLVVGTLFIAVPWAFVLHWVGRILVILLLGPQNKLLDMAWTQDSPTVEQRIERIFASRIKEARGKQEEASKLKSFRHVLFGKYATRVPPLLWSPHIDFPLPSSTSTIGLNKVPPLSKVEKLPLVPGQHLFGTMIPRPEVAWRENAAKSDRLRQDAKEVLRDSKKTVTFDIPDSPPAVEGIDSMLEEGVEITDEYDEEAYYVKKVLVPRPEESVRELGVEILGWSDASNPSGVSFKTTRQSTYELPSIEGGSDSDSDLMPSRSNVSSAALDPVRLPTTERNGNQSTIELGFEVSDICGEGLDDAGTHTEDSSTKHMLPPRHEEWLTNPRVANAESSDPKPASSPSIQDIDQAINTAILNSGETLHHDTILVSNSPPIPVPKADRQDNQSKMESRVEAFEAISDDDVESECQQYYDELGHDIGGILSDEESA